MKNLVYTLCLLLACLFSSCEKVDIETSDLIGGWSLDKVIVNGIDSEDLVGGGSATSHYLSFSEDGSYFRSYIHGSYQIIGNNIIQLDTEYDNGDAWDWEMTVIKVTPNLLVVKMELTEGEYGYNFQEFGISQQLTIIEQYIR